MCDNLQHVGDLVCGADNWVVLSRDRMMLVTEMYGSALQKIAAFWHAIWRVRCVVLRGLDFADIHDPAAHVKSIIQDPWVT